MTVRTARPARPVSALALGAVLALTISGCGKSETSTATPATASASAGQGAQQLETSAPTATPTTSTASTTAAAGCTLQKYGVAKGLDLKNLVVGFSQSEKEANPFRIAETQSIKAEAAKLGVKKLLATNAQSTLSKQISDIQDLIAQGAKALIVAPLNSTGLEPALAAAKAKHIPVVTIDRKLTGATACSDYLTFIGSNFVQQGHRAAKQLIAATGGKGKVAILLGASGNNVTTDRTQGFVDELKGSPGLSIVAKQTANFTRQEGQSVTEQLLQAHPNITAVYAENDEMALGALVALRSAGKNPGKDVKVVSVDGTRNAVQQVVKGAMNGVVESNPRFGPLAFSTLTSFLSGQPIAPSLIIKDRQYDPSDAAAGVASAY